MGEEKNQEFFFKKLLFWDLARPATPTEDSVEKPSSAF